MRCWFQLPTAGEPTAPIVSGLRHQCSLPGSRSRDLSRAGRGKPTSAGELSRGRGPGPFPRRSGFPQRGSELPRGSGQEGKPQCADDCSASAWFTLASVTYPVPDRGWEADSVKKRPSSVWGPVPWGGGRRGRPKRHSSPQTVTEGWGWGGTRKSFSLNTRPRHTL